MSKYALKTCIKRSKGKIAKLIVGQSGFLEGQLLLYLATRCRDLAHVKVMGDTLAEVAVVEMARVAENLKNLVLGCSTSVSAIAEVISQCDKLESLECTNIIANVPVSWNLEKPMGLRRLVLASNNNPAFLHLCLVSLMFPWACSHSNTVCFVAKIIRPVAEIGRIGTHGLGRSPSPTRFLHH